MVNAAGGGIREPRGAVGTPEEELAMPVSGGSEMRYLVITFLVAGLCAGVLGITLDIMAIRSGPVKEFPATKFEERLPRVMVTPKVVTRQVVTPPEPAPPAPAPQENPAAPTMTTPVSVAEGAQPKAPRFRHEYDGLCERYHLHREDYTRNGQPSWRCIK
jgi:hypothetical protein